MNDEPIIYDGGTRDYGILSELSKSVNHTLGDTSGRSVSMRTGHGFKKALNINISDDAAEDIVHAGMVGAYFLLRSQYQESRVGGFILLLGLIACYQNGK